MLRDKTGMLRQESSHVEQVKNNVISKQSAGPNIQVADFKTQAGSSVRNPVGGDVASNKPRVANPLAKPKAVSAPTKTRVVKPSKLKTQKPRK
jgi:hypothetical protein